MWTDPAADSAGPGPTSALGWCGPAPALTRHSCASASRSPPWSRVAHCEAPCTDAPSGDGPVVKKKQVEQAYSITFS